MISFPDIGRCQMDGSNLPVPTIKVMAVNLCALSAHTLPFATILSYFDSWLSFALRAASRNRAIFCCGVSFGGGGEAKERCVALEWAYGPVAVNRVASCAERAMLAKLETEVTRRRGEFWSSRCRRCRSDHPNRKIGICRPQRRHSFADSQRHTYGHVVNDK